MKSTDIIFVMLFSFSAGIVLKFPTKDVSGQDRMEVEGTSLLFEMEAEDMMGLILPLLLFLGLFIVLSDPMRDSFSVKRGGCSYLCRFRMLNRLKSSCRISNRFRIEGET